MREIGEIKEELRMNPATDVCEKSNPVFFLTSRLTYDKITLIREKQ
jgi:hypothetical protein